MSFKFDILSEILIVPDKKKTNVEMRGMNLQEEEKKVLTVGTLGLYLHIKI